MKLRLLDKLLLTMTIITSTSGQSGTTTLKKSIADHQVKIEQISSSLFSVGSIQISLLSEEQFQKINGKDWILMDGETDVTDSKYHKITGLTTVPNASGLFLRMRGESSGAIGVVQEDATAVNGLAVQSDGIHNHKTDFRAKTLAASGNQIGIPHPVYPDDPRYDWTSQNAGAHSHQLKGDAETRPINMAVNYFLKIN